MRRAGGSFPGGRAGAVGALLAAALLAPVAALADGALAVGVPGDVAKDGFAYGRNINSPTVRRGPRPGAQTVPAGQGLTISRAQAVRCFHVVPSAMRRRRHGPAARYPGRGLGGSADPGRRRRGRRWPIAWSPPARVASSASNRIRPATANNSRRPGGSMAGGARQAAGDRGGGALIAGLALGKRGLRRGAAGGAIPRRSSARDWPRGSAREVELPRGERRDGTLHLQVAPGLALEVQHREPVLVERINAFFGYRAVARLALKQGPPRAHAGDPPLSQSGQRSLSDGLRSPAPLRGGGDLLSLPPAEASVSIQATGLPAVLSATGNSARS